LFYQRRAGGATLERAGESERRFRNREEGRTGGTF
jgi:hypothetical protein